MLRIALIRPGATDFDDEGRIKGTLNLPLNEHGVQQVARMAPEVASLPVCAIYCSPCEAAEQTAAAIGRQAGVRVKSLEQLANLDHGLWHGRLIEEMKQTQPRLYRQLQEHPETVCPPQGEPLADAEQRVRAAIEKLIRKHPVGVVALVVPEPLTSLIHHYIARKGLGDLWKAECECGRWDVVEVLEGRAALAS